MTKEVKNERLFRFFADKANPPVEPSDLGRQQFRDKQSYGITPESPDPYYLHLSKGKWGFDWLSREHQQAFLRSMEPGTKENPNTNLSWDGLYQLWLDWEGDRWVLPHLLKWYKDLPEWIGEERDDPRCP